MFLHIGFHIAGIKYEIGKKYVRGFHNERRKGMKIVFVRHGEGEHTKGFAIKFKSASSAIDG